MPRLQHSHLDQLQPLNQPAPSTPKAHQSGLASPPRVLLRGPIEGTLTVFLNRYGISSSRTLLPLSVQGRVDPCPPLHGAARPALLRVGDLDGPIIKANTGPPNLFMNHDAHLVATRDIRAGEELLWTYEFNDQRLPVSQD
jgi:hypothetical protein